ncbi:hypothetical protein DFJ74DRAFT_377618 [Hyaloraphidium curvatum]|nr:hypothetical protein DFJ74DRAFT_377618 [Hyaloraphidium curvatum]
MCRWMEGGNRDCARAALTRGQPGTEARGTSTFAGKQAVTARASAPLRVAGCEAARAAARPSDRRPDATPTSPVRRHRTTAARSAPAMALSKPKPELAELPPAKGPGLFSPSDWSLLPRWFHLATAWYFATNSVMIYAMNRAAPSTWSKVAGIGGLIVGFLEHTSPYFPNIYVSVNTERLIGRIPTIAAYYAVSLQLKARSAWLAFITAGAGMFLAQPTLSTMDWKFHLEHGIVQHGVGSMALLATAFAIEGKLPGFANFVSGGKQ